MGTAKLLWGCLARMALYGLGLGAGLGAAYGATITSLYMAVGLFVDEAESSLLAGVGIALASMPVGAFLGMLGGLFVGAPAGLALGVVDGLVLGLLTRAFFFAPRDAADYRIVAARACATASVVAFAVAWAVPFSFDPGWVGAENTPGTMDGGPVDTLAFVIVPAFVMGWAGGLSGRKVAEWWVRESLGEPEQRGDQAPASERPETG